MVVIASMCCVVASAIAVAYACAGWRYGVALPSLVKKSVIASDPVGRTILYTILAEIVTVGGWGQAILFGYLVPDPKLKTAMQVVGFCIGFVAGVNLLVEGHDLLKRLKVREEKQDASRSSPGSTEKIQGKQALTLTNQEQSTRVTSPKPSQTYTANQSANYANQNAFAGLVGVDHAIQAILDALELPLRYPEKVRQYGLKPLKGILLYGPPGTGKTSLAKATGQYFGCPVWCITPAHLLDKWVGESEKRVSQYFAAARQSAAESGKPVILFFDEIDAIGRKRDGSHMNRPSDIVLNQLLTELDGITPNERVFVIGATNRLDVVDDALLRPGRFDRLIEIGLPGKEARKKLFALYLLNRPIAESIDLDALAEATQGMSPAVIAGICERAALRAAKRSIQTGCDGISMNDIWEAVRSCGGG